jgi:protein-S-isoprenylcysteine O-methyltransferase Ste14
LGVFEQFFHEILKYSMFGIGFIVFILLFFITAGYGRYTTKKWGPQLNVKLGWVIMECISPTLFFVYYITSPQTSNTVAIVFLLLWELHYIQRSFVYPFLIRGNKKIPLVIVLMGLVFNGINSYLQGRFLFVIKVPYPSSWLYSPKFILGTLIFLAGFSINLQSDYILRHLRSQGDTGENGYQIPHGSLFRYISCPNYFGEILEWIGWAVLTWSIAGLVFTFWTMANLIPRAISHHKWYHENFSEYPTDRKAIIPFFL